MTKEVRTQKLASLDGWRAVSIALVLACHSTFTSGFPPDLNRTLFNCLEQVGIWGVRFFFVISGFLITYLLLQEQAKNGFISLKKFYVRRAIRILPVCFFYLLILGSFTKYQQDASAWLANVTFTTNFFMIPHVTPTGHLWSLGVEEQFYLLWPCLLVFFINQEKGVLNLIKILMLPLIIAPTVRLIHYKQLCPDSLQFLVSNNSFFSKFDSLAYGCLAAILLTYWRGRVELFCKKYFILVALGGTLLVFSPWWLPLPGRLQAAGFESLQALGFSILLLQSLLYPAWGFYRWLNWKWVSQVGILSYSIYIWQQMFCGTGKTVFGIEEAWWVRFPVWILVTLLVAAASYFLLEKPFLKLRAKFQTG